MRILKQVSIEKEGRVYRVMLDWENKWLFWKRNYHVQTGNLYVKKKEAISAAKDWFRCRDFLEECNAFKYECSDYIDLTRTNGRVREIKGD